MRNHVERNVAVGQVPLMRVRHDLAFGELAHLVADRLERLVEAAIADGRAMMLAHQVGKPRAVFRGVAGRDQFLDFRRDAVRNLFERQSKIARAHHLALAHRDAAEHLREEFAKADPDEELFQLAEAPGFAHPLRIGGELAQRLGIGRKPRQPVRGALLACRPVWRKRGRQRRRASGRPASHRPATRPWRRPPHGYSRSGSSRFRAGMPQLPP